MYCLSILKASFKLNLGIRSYARKTVQKVRIVSTSSDGQISRRRIHSYSSSKAIPLFPALRATFRNLSSHLSPLHNVCTNLSFACAQILFNLKNIPSSLQTNGQKKSYARKTGEKVPKCLLQMDAPIPHPPILLFEASLINQAFQLYEAFNFAPAVNRQPGNRWGDSQSWKSADPERSEGVDVP